MISNTAVSYSAIMVHSIEESSFKVNCCYCVVPYRQSVILLDIISSVRSIRYTHEADTSRRSTYVGSSRAELANTNCSSDFISLTRGKLNSTTQSSLWFSGPNSKRPKDSAGYVTSVSI